MAFIVNGIDFDALVGEVKSLRLDVEELKARVAADEEDSDKFKEQLEEIRPATEP